MNDENVYERECLVCGYHVSARTPWSRWFKYLPHAVIKRSITHRREFREWRRALSHTPGIDHRGAA